MDMRYYQGYPQFQPPQMGIQTQSQTKYVEVVPVNSVDEASSCPMAAGSSSLFFARDDSFIAVKSVGVNGQITFDVFDKRPPAPVSPPFDPSAYVTREEFDALAARFSMSQSASKAEVTK